MVDRLATTDMGPKIGGLCLFWEELDPHLTQCRLGRGLPPVDGLKIEVISSS